MADPLPKVVLFLALLMVFITLINPGANAAWSTFTGALETGPVFPTLSSPSQATYNATLPFTTDYSGGTVTPYAPDKCDSSHQFNCLNTGLRTGNISFGAAGISEILGVPLNAGGNVGDIVFHLSCRNDLGYIPGTGLWVNITLIGAASPFFSASRSPLCLGAGGGYLFENIWHPSIANGTPITWFAGAKVSIRPWAAIGHENDNTTLGFFSITVFAQGTPPSPACTALDVACSITAAWNAVIQPIITFLGFIWYALQLLYAILAFIVTLIVGILIGLFGSFAYFFAIPGMPTLLQGIIDAILIVCLFIVILGIADRTIGLFGGAVNKL